MTRTTPEQASPLQTSAPHQRDDVWSPTYDFRVTGPTHDGSSVESGFEPGTLRHLSRDLTTRPPRPFHKPSETNLKKIIFTKKASNCFTMPTWTSVHMPYVLWLMSFHLLQAVTTIL
ncbi:hypothetical protein AVEN_187254-1 [Araneus ventricosus]|uniref:Uncharacterized protein n=1 Tax=Araneus ventricosus TaxID=182803 RepID=A0A4Y2Q2N8_ARAVE|nr:hypothetical protein AVEN_187254-1 [Araneus ventricosus]